METIVFRSGWGKPYIWLSSDTQLYSLSTYIVVLSIQRVAKMAILNVRISTQRKPFLFNRKFTILSSFSPEMTVISLSESAKWSVEVSNSRTKNYSFLKLWVFHEPRKLTVENIFSGITPVFLKIVFQSFV